jgi:phage terminase large subunit GpA-like protein
MSEVRAFLTGILKKAYQPIAKLALEFWAEANITIGSKESIDNPGAYKREHAVYAPRLLDLFMDGPEWRTLLVMKSSQSGLTFHVLIMICRRVAEMATSIIYVIDSITNARDLSKTRLQPLLKSCKATALDCEASEDEMNTLTYELPRAIIRLAGSGSAGQVASKPADVVAGDELDKWKLAKGEAHKWLLLIQRIKRSEFGKAIGFSTPTVETAITSECYQSGSQHKYFVPCPRCSHKQTITLDHMRFGHCKQADGRTYDLLRVLRETYMECEFCKGRIEEDEKLEMLMAGEWRPTNFKEIEVEGEKQMIEGWAPGEMSAHISDFYSMHPRSSWGTLVFEFIQAQGNPKKLHDWTNGRAGLPVKQTVSSVSQKHVLRLRGKYKRGTLPVVPCVATLHVDNQGDHQKWVSLGWLPNGTCYVIDYGKHLALNECREVAARKIPTPAKDVFVQRVNIDEGGKDGTSYEVRSFCFPLFPMYSPCKGRGGVQVKNTIVFSDSAVSRGGLDKIPVCHFDDDAFKRILYIERIRKFDPIKADEFDLPRLWLPEDVGQDFVRELCGEELVKEIGDNGVVSFVWKQKPPNDWGDCIKMGYVMWNVIGDKFQPAKPL